MDSESRTPDERLWATIAHGSILLTPLGGIGTMIAMGIWLFKRRASSYIGYQALQSFIFQAMFLFVVLVFVPLVIPVFQIEILLILAGILYGLYGAYQCRTGRDFKYLWIGNLIPSSRPRE